MSRKLSDEEKAIRKEQRKQYLKEWIANNKDRFKEIQKKSKNKNAEKRKEYETQFKETHKDWKYEWDKEYQKTIKGVANRRIQAYKRQDEKNGFGKDAIDFDSDWIIENILSKQCVYCGESDFHKLGCNRLDNSKPHTKDNVEPCCRQCNIKLELKK